MNKDSTLNHSYFPIILKDEEQLLNVKKALNEKNVFPRRYFYPSLDTLNYINPKQFCKNSRDISERIICLPMYPELEENVQKLIVNLINKTL